MRASAGNRLLASLAKVLKRETVEEGKLLAKDGERSCNTKSQLKPLSAIRLALTRLPSAIVLR